MAVRSFYKLSTNETTWLSPTEDAEVTNNNIGNASETASNSASGEHFHEFYFQALSPPFKPDYGSGIATIQITAFDINYLIQPIDSGIDADANSNIESCKIRNTIGSSNP